jgi:hypothetical protein
MHDLPEVRTAVEALDELLAHVCVSVHLILYLLLVPHCMQAHGAEIRPKMGREAIGKGRWD